MANLFDRTYYPTKEPSKLVVGDRWTWKRADLGVNYDPSSYTLKYSLRLEGSTAEEIEITAQADGSHYVVEVSQSTTKDYTAGRYHWQAYISRNSDGERLTVGEGRIHVLPDRDTSTADPRSHVKKVLDALKATLEGKATEDQTSLSVGSGEFSRSISRMSWSEILAAYEKYKVWYRQELEAERIKNGKGSGRNILVRF